MQIETHKQYEKMWVKLNTKQQYQVMAALRLFVANPRNPKLRLHQLKGKYYPQYSISAGADLRVHFAQVGETRIVLMLVGTHSQLY